MSRQPYMPGPGGAPWRQRHWDARAAANFVGGGAGSGLVVATAVAGVHGPFAAATLAVGLALVGGGLFAVWLETGRRLRAINVLRNPRTSWMSREAYAAMGLFASGGLAAWLEARGSPAALPAMLVALIDAPAFAYCQGRMLNAAKGIPAWRSPAVPKLIVATALAEGAGAWWIAAAWAGERTSPALALFVIALIARFAAWFAYRATLGDGTRAALALASPGIVLAMAGTVVPLALLAASIPASAFVSSLLVGTAGALALATGACFKLALVLRASFNQGYSLPRMPVRGQPSASRP